MFVPANNRLTKATDFATGTNLILALSRLKVGWGAAGMAAGAYEAALRYAVSRKQFGKPIAKYQITQLKLSKMLSMCESMLAVVVRTQELFDMGKATIGQIGRVKSFTTQQTRDVCQMAREICGGNGILLENQVIKTMLDIESIHTYEGTYEVNMLVSGREITGGMQAFK